MNIAANNELSGQQDSDRHWMQHALNLARQAGQQGEVPVGAVLVANTGVLGEGYNQTIGRHDASAHAEIMALREAGQKLGNYRMPGTTLYVTLEPCLMCAGAIIHARIARLVYAADDPKTGAAGSCFDLLQDQRHNHQLLVCGGVLAMESARLLQEFFRARR